MKAKVLSGIDRLDILDTLLKGQRVGLVTAGSAIDRECRLAVDVICDRYQVTTLFNTIFGIRGEFIYGERVPFYVDQPTGLPVHSIFNSKRTAPTPEMMENVDVMVYDIKEAGARYYEYLYTLADLMKACAAVKKPLVVLDRVNPIGGEKVEGTVCPENMHTMVGDYRLAQRTGLTSGEFARYVNGEYAIGCDLHVVPVSGWQRRLYMDETDAPWVLPSPSLPHATANLLYAGMCVFEGVATINEGRGTTKPFELIGAPWMDGKAVAQLAQKKGLPGVRYAPTHYRPSGSKHSGEVCSGVQIHILDRNEFQSVRTALTLLDAVREVHPNEIVWRDCSAGHDLPDVAGMTFEKYADKLLGDKRYTTGELDCDSLLAAHAEELKAYIARKQKYHLYE